MMLINYIKQWMFLYYQVYMKDFGMVAIEAEVAGLKVICSENVPEEVNLTRKSKFYKIRE